MGGVEAEGKQSVPSLWEQTTRLGDRPSTQTIQDLSSIPFFGDTATSTIVPTPLALQSLNPLSYKPLTLPYGLQSAYPMCFEPSSLNLHPASPEPSKALKSGGSRGGIKLGGLKDPYCGFYKTFMHFLSPLINPKP